ncbi:heterokaryon incompatibility protein-domain-containing protein [Xylaria arbuscula]|nr:heterokaryon incompatibility protein-domain-containing protein [Xylaria arbuscula]
MASRRPLKTDGSEIRLLDLRPGRTADEIRCALRTVTFDQNPIFDALSYVWGDPKDTNPILVDEQPFQATVNLEAALRALRHTRKVRVLWVDAICINQDDVEEKNVQVGRMHLIYPRAHRVLVWLGPPSPDVELAESWIRTYASRWPFAFLRSCYWASLDLGALFSVRAKYEKCLATIRAYGGYIEFLNNPYWKRMWTFQEYGLATRRPLCLFGGRAIQHMRSNTRIFESLISASFDAFLEAVELAISPCGRRFIEREPGWWRSFKAQVQALEAKFDSLDRIGSAGDIIHDCSPTKFGIGGRPAALLLMFLTLQLECSHPHDRIYALYGLFPELSNTYPADYTKPYRQVTLETAAYCLNATDGGMMFCIFRLRESHLCDDSYPSWVPEFRSRAGLPDFERATYVRPLKDCDKGPRTYVTEDLMILHIWGRTLGRCKVTYRFSTEYEACSAQIREVLLEPFYLLGCDDLGSNSLRNQKNLRERLAYACILRQYGVSFDYIGQLLCGTAKLIAEKLNECIQAQPILVRRTGEMERDTAYRDVDLEFQKLRGRAFIITDNGFFGIASHHVQDGDLVVLPPRTRTRIILRMIEEDTGHQSDVYKLVVGTTYIDGLCEGEFEDAAAAFEILEQRDLQEFRIR